jgi:hypothetical protein
MRARAAEQGRELPETPPWEAAEQRRKEMMERMEQYRATFDAMTEEQKEAVSALFGRERPPMDWSEMGAPSMPRSGYGRMPCGRDMTECPRFNRPWPSMGRGQRPMMYPEMGPDMGPGMGPGMGPEMGPGMGPEMGPGMGPEMGRGMGPGMGPGYPPEPAMPERGALGN